MVNKLTTWSFLEPLLYSQEFLHLAEISRELKSPHATVRKHLNEFEKQGVVIKKTKGRLTLYKINGENLLLFDYLALSEKEKLVRKCQESLILKEIVSFLHKLENKEILLFGSIIASKKANDIDVLIIREPAKDKIKDFEKKFNLKFHIIDLKLLKEVTKTLKEEIIKKHLIIQGSETIIKWMLEK
jgi:hypothetical protein